MNHFSRHLSYYSSYGLKGPNNLNKAQLLKISTGQGFIAALDQSGGSTPKALKLYGLEESEYGNSADMYNLIHEIRHEPICRKVWKRLKFERKRI